MTTHSGYILDYAGDDCVTHVDDFFDDLAGAKAAARRMSKLLGTAYVIRYTAGASPADYRQHGQAVFVQGAFSHTDDDFDARLSV